MSAHKLNYFSIPASGARGFVTRIALRSAAADGKISSFEDNRITFPDWPAVKASGMAPLGQMPFLEVNGSVICESVPISSYSCKIAGLYPTDPFEALKQDEIVAIIDEAWNLVAKTSKDQPETRIAYANEVAPKFLKVVESRLGDSTFFNGSSPGFADLWVYVYVSFLTCGFFDHIPIDFVERAAPKVAELATRVKGSELYTKFGTPE